MAHSKKQNTSIGNGHTKTPILASEKDHTAGQLQPSQVFTSIESGSTKPLSIAEALSLLQTLCFDLRSMGCEVSILARNNMIYLIGKTPASIGQLATKDGHILINGRPVILAEKV
jgi:hypothetical protein